MRGFHIFIFIFISFLSSIIHAHHDDEKKANSSWVVRRDQRSILAHTEYGEISAVNITDGLRGGPYLLQFLTLDPNSLFLPVLLHADAVFYVHTGSGTLSWTDEDRVRNVDVKRGDVYTVPAGSLFYVQSKLESERQKLRIHAIFSNTDDGIYNPSVGAYSGIRDLIVGFDRRVLQAAFQVSEEVLDEVINGTSPAPIVHAVSKKKTVESLFWELEARYLKSLMGGSSEMINKKKKPKKKAYNIFDKDPDFKNCNGWSTTVNKEDWSSLGESNIGVFMVNLTKGSMMGPHWNPSATEMAVVLQGQGMIRVVCSANSTDPHCRNMRIRVEEGDVFGVPRFHPMAQMSFNNDSFVFMGFSTSTRKNYPQFLAGKRSVLQVLDRYVLAMSFNVTNTTIDRLLAAQTDSIILECTSCAEEEERIMEEDIRREKEREEEEEARKREEEEEAKRREEEEARRREEERRQREEEEARRREEEERRRREEEEAKKRQEEEEEEEEEAKREEEAKKREEEEAKREEEERRRREEEEEEAKREEEERRRQQEEEEEEEAKREEEERRRRQEEEERRRRQEEEEEAKREEEERHRREEDEAKKRQEEEERQRRQEESRRREEEEEAKRRREEEEEEEEKARKRAEEEERQRKEHQKEEKGREESPRTKEEEAASKEYEERQHKAEEERRRWHEEGEKGRRHEEEEEEEEGSGRRNASKS